MCASDFMDTGYVLFSHYGLEPVGQNLRRRMCFVEFARWRHRGRRCRLRLQASLKLALKRKIAEYVTYLYSALFQVYVYYCIRYIQPVGASIPASNLCTIPQLVP